MKIIRVFSLMLLTAIMLSTVSLKCFALNKISLNKKSVFMNVKSSLTLKLKGAKGKIVWKSTNKSVATVSKKGKIKAKKAGKTIIIAKHKNKSYKCKVVVKNKKVKAKNNKKNEAKIINVTNLSLNTDEIALFEGDSYNLVYSLLPQNATIQEVKWSTSDDSVAEVDSKGVIIAKSEGVATIQAKANDNSEKTANCIVTVKRNYLKSIKDYIILHGNNSDAGNKGIAMPLDEYSSIYIQYNANEDSFQFGFTAFQSGIKQYVTMELKESSLTKEICEVDSVTFSDDDELGFEFINNIEKNSFTSNSYPSVELKQIFNTDYSKAYNLNYYTLHKAFQGWDYLLRYEVGVPLEKIGFPLYKYNFA